MVKFIRILPRTRKWAEVSFGLRQLVTGLRGFAPFTYRGLVEFLAVAEDVLESLGDEQVTRQEAAHQLIYHVLIEPAGHVNLPPSLVERNAFETQQMRAYNQERPEVAQCRRVAKRWFRWVETQGVEYPRRNEGTWLRI